MLEGKYMYIKLFYKIVYSLAQPYPQDLLEPYILPNINDSLRNHDGLTLC